MVGVKGKYKGCNTCRGRRVKCDNTRPFCRNCIDHGRVCEGYERETVFIVGTVDDKGRCTSHPPRNLAGLGPAASSSSSSPASPSRGAGAKQKKRQAVRFRDNNAASPSPSALLSPPGGVPPPSLPTPALTDRPAVPGARDLAPVEPWAPAWSDSITLSAPPEEGLYRVRFLAIRTQLGAVVVTPAGEGRAHPHGIRPTLPPSCRASERPRFDGPEQFRLASQCFLRLPLREREGQAAGSGHPDSPGMTEKGLCLFLYEQNISAAYNNNPSWKVPTAPGGDILAQGPVMFQTFPAHHFFARVYRPIAILTTLLTRTSSPLAAPDWTTVPYARHPKTSLDALLDMVALVPGLLARADRLPLSAAVSHGRHRLEARDLVAHGAVLEARLAAWYAQLERAAAANRTMPLLYWTAGSVDLFAFAGASSSPGRPTTTAHIPFADTYEFASTVVGLGHVAYWTALMTLYECMDQLVPFALGRSEDDMPAPGPTSGMVGSGGSSSSSTVGDAAAAVVSYGSPELPPACDPARYQVRERRKLAANICRSLDWIVGPSDPDVFSSVVSSSVASSSSPAFPSAAYSSPPPSSFSVPPLSSSLSPASSPSSSSSWLCPPPLLSGAAGSVAPLPNPQPDPAMRRGGSLGPADPELQDEDTRGRDPNHHHDQQPPYGGTSHPDLAAIPLWAVERFYDGLGADGALERAWCRGFRTRLAAVGRAVDGGVGGGWLEVARFG